METETYTVVNYVVEVRKPGRRARTAVAIEDSADDGEARYQDWLRARGSLKVRLVKRTAVVTDEVFSSGQQEN